MALTWHSLHSCLLSAEICRSGKHIVVTVLAAVSLTTVCGYFVLLPGRTVVRLVAAIPSAFPKRA